jgi:hypothetical protein
VASPASPSWVSFVHPVVSTAGLVLCWLALRLGLAAREARLKRPAQVESARGRHLRLARPSVLLILLSFPMGLGSAVFVRDLKPLDTAHGWLAAGATACFLATAVLGATLAKGDPKRRGPHVALSLLGSFLGLIAGLTGIELLP